MDAGRAGRVGGRRQDAPERHGGSGAARHRRVRQRPQLRQRHDAAHRCRPGRLRSVRRCGGQRRPRDRGRDRRERAEPQPLLAPAVQRRRQRRGGARVRDAARAYLRRDQGRRPGREGARRRGLTERRRCAGSAAHPLADGLHPRPRGRVSGERAVDADHGRLRVPPVRGQLEHRTRERRAPEHHDDRAGGLREARRAPGRGVRRHGATRVDTPDHLRRVRRRDADPGGEDTALHRYRAGHDETGDGAGPGRVLPPGDPARLLPAERRGSLSLPRVRRDRARRLAVRALLRRRHAEVEPGAGPVGDRPVPSRQRRAMPWTAAARQCVGDAARAHASSSSATSTARTSHSSTGSPAACSSRGRARRSAESSVHCRSTSRPARAGTASACRPRRR